MIAVLLNLAYQRGRQSLFVLSLSLFVATINPHDTALYVGKLK
jgi:hypothetical protein